MTEPFGTDCGRVHRACKRVVNNDGTIAGHLCLLCGTWQPWIPEAEYRALLTPERAEEETNG